MNNPVNKAWLHHNSWEEVAEYLKRSQTIVVPVGSIEQHGGHLPLGTDTMVAEAIAESVAIEANVLTTPAVSFGWSPHHMILPGSITIRPEVLIEYLYDIIESLGKHGFNKFLLINGHRMVNISWLQIAAERAKRVLGVDVLLADPAYLTKELSTKENVALMGHADEIETSHMLYIQGDMVHLELAKDYGAIRPEYKEIDPRNPADCLCYVPSTVAEMEDSVRAAKGASGRPSKASVEFGARYHEWMIKKLVRIIDEWQ